MTTLERRRLMRLGLAAAVVAGTGALWSGSAAQADDGGSVAGQVVGQDGAPVAGANVTVTSAMLDAGDATFTTDEAGRFLLTPAPAGLYDVTVEREGYRPGSVTSLRVGDNQTARVEIVLERRAPGESSY